VKRAVLSAVVSPSAVQAHVTFLSSSDTFVKLAEIYERFRLLERAEAMVARALELNPLSPLALLVRARLNRLGGRLEEAERSARSFLGSSDPNTWSTRIRGWYELGAILDRQERYEEAMAAFLEAKALIRPNAARFLTPQQSVRAQLERAASEITAEVLQRWRDRPVDQPRSLALLGGHPRSGTTLLEQVMDSHPDILSSEETPIFYETYLDLKKGSPDSASILSILESASARALQQARENYFRFTEALLGSKISGRLLIDKNPSLTTMIPAVIRVFPETKFLVAVRDPRDVCISFFMQPLPLNLSSAAYLTLEGTVGEYASLMGFWKTLAPRIRNPHLEIRYEDLVEDLETVSRRVLEFLNVPWDARVLRFDEHAREKLVRSPTYADVTKPVFKGAVGRWRNYQKYLEPWLEQLEPFVQAFGYG